MDEVQAKAEDVQRKKEEVQRKKEDAEFLRWLSPSHQAVEAQLLLVRHQRGEGTLQWAKEIDEFHKWRTSDVASHSKERMLWIRGTLGVGKSTMAGYFIELLKFSTPAPSIVAFFFCRSGQVGLTKARDIIRTLAYQCMNENPQARRVLDNAKSISFRIDDSVPIRSLFATLISEPLLKIQHDIYIILDGIDEADLDSKDVFGDRVQQTEMEVLIDCLAHLPSARILFDPRF